MRDVKYRVWNNGKMYNVRAIVWHAGHVANIEVFTNKGTDYLYSIDAKLLQYIGLKDRNDKEIYKGDLVKWYINHGSNFILCKIIYMKEEAQFVGQYKDEYGNPRFISLINSHVGLEVIGNCYENPELLEEYNGRN